MSPAAASPFTPLVTSWRRALRARNLSENTLRIYTGAAEALATWLVKETPHRSWEQVGKADLEGWIGHLLDTRTSGHASNQYRAVQQLFRWLAEEDEIPANPMARMRPPALEEKLVPVLTDEQLRLLFKSCSGKDMVSRRDLAILRLFTSTGMRLAEMAGLRLADVDLDDRLATVTGKGRRDRVVRFDPSTALALDRYLRSRTVEKYAGRPELWLSEKNRGVLGRNGIYQMVVRRGEQLRLDINPHMFRHTFGHRYLNRGGAEGDLMEQAGWRSPQMVRRYGASAKAERARTAYDRVGVMEDL
ncbi:MAG: tyrosine-type recombinase/integrase [Actinomycetota bacterium]|nr:tyrosine-type recombinase/integrase [Actinomycetota bacterium]